MPDDSAAFGDALARAVLGAVADAFVDHELNAHRQPDAHSDCDFCASSYLYRDVDPHADDDPTADTAY